MTRSPHALVVEDDINSLCALVDLLEQEGFSVDGAVSLTAAKLCLQRTVPDLVLLDLVLPDGNGLYLLPDINTAMSEVVLITGHASVDSAIEAIRHGASDYLTKPIDIPRLRAMLRRIAAKDLAYQPQPLEQMIVNEQRFGPLVGKCEIIQDLYTLVQRIAVTDATVLLSGEDGTGKSLVAEIIHKISKRAGKPYLVVNCSATPSEVLHEEFLGGVPNTSVKSCFERAAGGTLVIEEIADLPPDLQLTLLGVLESKKIQRIGGEEISVDIRVLASSNRPLEEALQQGRFREDLLYRLRVFPIYLPPLRERGEDLNLLINHFINQFNAFESSQKTLAAKTLDKLREYDWPGNVRELKNVLYHAHLLANDIITPNCLPRDFGRNTTTLYGRPELNFQVGDSIAEVERRLIEATLRKCDGNKKQTADILGISLKTLYNRLNFYKMI